MALTSGGTCTGNTQFTEQAQGLRYDLHKSSTHLAFTNGGTSAAGPPADRKLLTSSSCSAVDSSGSPCSMPYILQIEHGVL